MRAFEKDYVLLKVLATRELDLEDVASVVEGQRGRLDVELMRREVTLATEIPDHDIAARFATLLN